MSTLSRAESESRGVHKVRVWSFMRLFWFCSLAHQNSLSRCVEQTNMKTLTFADDFCDASQGIIP